MLGFSSIKKTPRFLFGEYGHVFVFYKNLVFHFSNIQNGFSKQYILFLFYLCVFSTGPFIKIVNKASINKIIIYTILKQLTIVYYWRSRIKQNETEHVIKNWMQWTACVFVDSAQLAEN